MITLLEKPCINCLGLIKKAQSKIELFDAEILLAYLLGTGRADLYIYEHDISEEIIKRFTALADRRAIGVPLQYLIGKTEFMGLEFVVTPDVLIPRPETELLVEKAIELIQAVDRGPWTVDMPAILDLGTGSGNIAISLTKFIEGCKIMASDISAEALSVAKKNAQLHGVEKQIKFVLSDLFKDLPKTKFDAIISNPPYVGSAEICNLQRELRFEPRIAIDGGKDGLDFYRLIIEESGRFLKRSGLLILELGFGQVEEVAKLLRNNLFTVCDTIIDYDYIKRAVVAEWIG